MNPDSLSDREGYLVADPFLFVSTLNEVDGRLYRAGQDTFPQCGLAIGAFEITTLNRQEYVEVAHPGNPVLSGTGRGWNADGMHHLDINTLTDAGLEWRVATLRH